MSAAGGSPPAVGVFAVFAAPVRALRPTRRSPATSSSTTPRPTSRCSTARCSTATTSPACPLDVRGDAGDEPRLRLPARLAPSARRRPRARRARTPPGSGSRTSRSWRRCSRCGLYELVAGARRARRGCARSSRSSARRRRCSTATRCGAGSRSSRRPSLLVLGRRARPAYGWRRHGVRARRCRSRSASRRAARGAEPRRCGLARSVPVAVVARARRARAHGAARAVRHRRRARRGDGVLLAIPSLWLAVRLAAARPARSPARTSSATSSGRLSWLQVVRDLADRRLPRARRTTSTSRVLSSRSSRLRPSSRSSSRIRRRAFELPLAVGTCRVRLRRSTSASARRGSAARRSRRRRRSCSRSRSPVPPARLESGRRVEAIAWSVRSCSAACSGRTRSQYHDVDLAPSARLAELATIGHRFSGEGPTLMTEYEPYGARHFLRGMDAEAASGAAATPDRPARRRDCRRPASRPTSTSSRWRSVLRVPDARPAALGRRRAARRRCTCPSGRGRYYQVWQRPASPDRSRAPLARQPSCSRPRSRRAAGCCGSRGSPPHDHGRAGRRRTAACDRDRAERHGRPALVVRCLRRVAVANCSILTAPYSFTSSFASPVGGSYGVWVGGSFKSAVGIDVDGRSVGRARDSLNWPDTFTYIGSVRLAPGRHTLRFRYDGPGLRPGSGGIRRSASARSC